MAGGEAGAAAPASESASESASAGELASASIALAAVGLPPATRADRMPGLGATVWHAHLADGREVAVRVLPPGEPAAREVAALRLAASLGLPVPAVIAEGCGTGGDVVVSSWCAGRTIGDDLAGGADPAPLGRLFGQAQARLHAPVADGAALAALGPSRALAGVPLFAGEPPVLTHLDFQPFNVLTQGGRVTGIIDWANAAVADRRADIARTWAILSIAQTIVPVPGDRLATFVTAWRAGYADVRPLPEVEQLAPFIAAAGHALGAEWGPRVVGGGATLAVLHAIDDLIDEWGR